MEVSNTKVLKELQQVEIDVSSHCPAGLVSFEICLPLSTTPGDERNDDAPGCSCFQEEFSLYQEKARAR